jgi:hypothetical protein
VHAVLLLSRYLATHHREELLQMLDVEDLLIVALRLGCLGVELVLGQERIDELPICAVRRLHLPDRAELFEQSLRVEELTLRPDIVQIGILDDAFEMRLRFREEDSRHDDVLDLLDTLCWMMLLSEPLAGDLCADVFVFLILYCEASIMKKTSDLEIIYIFTLDPFCHGEVRRAVEHSTSMIWIVIWICLALFEEEVGIHASGVEEGSRHRMIQD